MLSVEPHLPDGPKDGGPWPGSPAVEVADPAAMSPVNAGGRYADMRWLAATEANVACLGVKSKAQGGEYLLLLNDIEVGEPGREPWCREDDEVGLGENDSSDVISGGLAIITLPPGKKEKTVTVRCYARTQQRHDLRNATVSIGSSVNV